ncbi:hypothetical protein [Cellulomonas pakistanensis]|uniref:Uncharacterized protein n=1 Tax=Cellulomonas pakistanensis TaxID=992287 RepID=A0A919U4V6_9CELL|nr:hypothetical protein [Cellulomonas pakistanensis]GIG35454.1 hypothetical protein Cpa01nite_08350 [Cellulomonas pakistanensis]
MAHEHARARRAAGVTLAWLGCAGLAVSMARALTWDGDAPVPAGSCVVDRIAVDYDVGYVAGLGGYGVTAASLSDVPEACVGREVAVTLHGADDAALAEARTPVTAPTTVVPVPGDPVPVADLAGVSLALVTDAAEPAAAPAG